MFDSRLTPREIKEKFSWQACKKLANDVEGNGGTIIKDNIEKYGDCFGKIIRINKVEYILIYFNSKNDTMKTIYINYGR